MQLVQPWVPLLTHCCCVMLELRTRHRWLATVLPWLAWRQLGRAIQVQALQQRSHVACATAVGAALWSSVMNWLCLLLGQRCVRWLLAAPCLMLHLQPASRQRCILLAHSPPLPCDAPWWML